MSSQSKRRAESEEIAHKKKPRKGGDEEDEFSQNEDGGPEVEHDKSDVPEEDNTNKGTRGKRVDYSEVLLVDGPLDGPDDDDDSEFLEEIQKDKTGAPARPRTRSPQRKPTNIENSIEEEEDDDDGEDEEYEGDGGDEEEEGEYDSDEDE